ncbi:MAG: hypothetical protein WCJ81_02235 [bacterium]
MAVGVASHNAHGHAITNTLTKQTIPIAGFHRIIHAMRLIMAISRTRGTNLEDILSTSFCTGALDPCAF